jgi:hypothetical protein
MKMSQLVTYECISCGKKRTAPLWRFKKPRDEYMCQPCGNSVRAHDPEWLEKNRLGIQKRSQNPTWKENNKKANQKSAQNLVYKENHKKIMGELAKDPTWLANQKVGAQKRENNPVSLKNRNDAVRKACKDPTWLANQTIRNKNKANDPEWLKNNKLAAEKRSQDPNWVERTKAGIKLAMANPEWKESRKRGAAKRELNPDFVKSRTSRNQTYPSDPKYIERLLVGITGQGFWYGHPIINKERPKSYCELWNRDLWNRIDAAWNFKSAISGKTKEENKDRELDRHHVYWQEKACCEWDEDTQGYYATINIGTFANPIMYKHYIKGDPNKFVLLTRGEHGIIKGNKKLGTTKLTWIKFFEELIEQREKEGKKCYLSKEEYKVYKLNN